MLCHDVLQTLSIAVYFLLDDAGNGFAAAGACSQRTILYHCLHIIGNAIQPHCI